MKESSSVPPGRGASLGPIPGTEVPGYFHSTRWDEGAKKKVREAKLREDQGTFPSATWERGGNRPLRPLRGRLLNVGKPVVAIPQRGILPPANLLSSLRDGGMRLRRPSHGVRRLPTASSHWDEGGKKKCAKRSFAKSKGRFQVQLGNEGERAIQPLQGWAVFCGDTQGRRWCANPGLSDSILSGFAEGRRYALQPIGNEGAGL